MRYVVENIEGGVNDVVNLLDNRGIETEDLAQASAIVVKVTGGYVSADVDDYDIYTVH